MGNFVLMCIVALATFVFFYFNVPYWTGKEMHDVAKNGIYRCFYMLCSSLGWYQYKALERINNKVDRLLRVQPGGVAHSVLNLLIYMGVVFALSSLYDTGMGAAIGGEVNELKIMDSDSYAKLSDLLLFWGILNNFTEVTSIGEFFVALHNSLFNIVVFVVGTIIFFSIMFGLLSQKVQELCLVERFIPGSSLASLLNYEPEAVAISHLPKQIMASIVDFCNKLSIMRNLEILGVQITFCVLLASYSLMKTVLGEQPDTHGLLLDLLDESGVVSTIGSFIISFIFAKCVAVVGRICNRFLPESVSSRLHQLSVRGNEMVDTLKQKRDKWSSEFDSVYQRTQKWRGVYTPVREMHLD